MIHWNRAEFPSVYQVWVKRSIIEGMESADWRLCYGSFYRERAEWAAKLIDRLSPQRRVLCVELNPLFGLRSIGGNQELQYLLLNTRILQAQLFGGWERETAARCYAGLLDEHNNEWEGVMTDPDALTPTDLEDWLYGTK